MLHVYLYLVTRTRLLLACDLVSVSICCE